MSAREASHIQRASRTEPRSPDRTSKARVVASDLPDEVLVHRAREGDRWAQEALFWRYIAPLTGLGALRPDHPKIDGTCLEILSAPRTNEQALLPSWGLGVPTSCPLP